MSSEQELKLQLLSRLNLIFAYMEPDLQLRIERMMSDEECMTIITRLRELGFNPYLGEIDDMEPDRKRVCLTANRQLPK